jgi:hypothetical protein
MRKKNMVIKILVEEALQRSENGNMLLYQAASIMGVSFQSFYRYRKNIDEGNDAVGKRGRKLIPRMDHTQLKHEIHSLQHGSKRSAGSSDLYFRYKGLISRDEFNQIVKEVREEVNKGRREQLIMVNWECPHMVWSMDDFEYKFKGIKHYVHQVQDLASRFKFEPVTRRHVVLGVEVAENLHRQFNKYGAPLFMKRDNGSNLNHSEVVKVLENFGVIPLNNPTYYPKFNGGMERAQNELQIELDRIIHEFENPDTFPFAVRQAVHNLNHNPRPNSLDGQYSCFVWQMHSSVKFDKQFRKELYDDIEQLALDITKEVNYYDNKLVLTRSWREAVKIWLHKNGHITMKRNGKVLPI